MTSLRKPSHLHSQTRRLLSVGAVIGAAFAAIVACGNGQPNAAGPGENPANVPGCATPAQGCGCTTGSVAECGIEVRGEQDFIWCAQGTRACTAGAWGVCDTTGAMSVHSASASIHTATVTGGGLHTMTYGAQTACMAAGLDPCDPYCQVQSDTAVGLDAGGIIALVDGGLAVTIGCGNGAINGVEECDDGNTMTGDGCNGGCKLEPGYKCPTPGAPCVPTTCGDGVKEGTEQCDDGNLRAYDGCSPTCISEPVCALAGCAPVCGDGLKFTTELCDDGNNVNGDGCSSTCVPEMGATCMTVTASLPASITVPVVYRDFTPATNPDFEFPFSGPGSLATGVIPGVAQAMLPADQAPTLNTTHGTVTSAATFNEWYRDSVHSKIVLGTLTLNKQPDNSYVYNSQLLAADPYVSFFPIDGKGYGNYAATGHNYSFTSELRYPFTFQGGEVLDFLGDDDLFVFINGRLAVDLGGAHGPEAGSITLNAANAAALALTAGNTYRLDVFQAERHSTGSSYKLTLRGFVQAKSYCSIPTSTTFVRDFQASCGAGERPVWQVFRWKALVPPLTSIDYRAATADTLAALPVSPPAAAPTTVPIGSATPLNSPFIGPEVWTNEIDAMLKPIPVSKHLQVEGANTKSKTFLRVYMTFNSIGPVSPRLDEWQQQYDCVPVE